MELENRAWVGARRLRQEVVGRGVLLSSGTIGITIRTENTVENWVLVARFGPENWYELRRVVHPRLENG